MQLFKLKIKLKIKPKLKSELKSKLKVIIFFAGVLVLAGCEDPSEEIAALGPITDRIVDLCPYDIPVCAYSAAPAEGESSPADFAWENFQKTLHFRPNNPSFRAMTSLLDRQFANWTELAVLEYIMPGFDESTSVAGKYGFIILADMDGMYSGATNISAGKDFRPTRNIRAINIDHEAAKQCFITLETSQMLLPASLVWNCDFANEPIVILHYLNPSRGTWSCAIRDPNVFEIVSLANKTAVKREPSNADVRRIIKPNPDPDGRKFLDAVLNEEDFDIYQKIRDRYAIIMSSIQNAAIPQKIEKEDEENSDGEMSDEENPSAEISDEPTTQPV